MTKDDGIFSRRRDDYEAILDDARETPVIFHDTEYQRAYRTNVDDLILHTLLHRRQINAATTTTTASSQSTTPGIEEGEITLKIDDLEFANEDRKVFSARDALIRNADRVFALRHKSGSELEKTYFKDEVKLLHSTLDALWASIYDSKSSPWK